MRIQALIVARLPWLPVLLLTTATIIAVHSTAIAQDIDLQTASGGITIGGSRAAGFTSGFGNVNGLGLGTPGAGLTIVTTGVTGGVLYTTPYNIVISGAGGKTPAAISAYVSSNFAHATILGLRSCYPNSSCSGAASYATISTSSASPTPIIPSPGLSQNQTVVASLALYVSDANGTGAFTGFDSATLSFLVYDGSNMTVKHTRTLTLSVTVQTAVRFNLSTASGGLTVAPGTDYSVDYGNVNGIGIGTPAFGLSIVSASGGAIYSTPILLTPSFSSFSSTSGTLKVYVSTDFVHATTLELRDSSSSGGTYSAISKNSGSPTAITTTASGMSVTRYLGLFTSRSTTFTGADNATLTYILVVP